MLHVTNCKYIEQYKIWVSFDDNTDGVIDLKDSLDGNVFKSLKNLENFREIKYSPELQTIVWPNGADFAPEYLKSKMNNQI